MDHRSAMVGIWSLITQKRFRNGAFYRETMGEGAQGRIIYDASGWMCAFLMNKDWPSGQLPATWQNVMSYSGRWHVENGNTVIHAVDFASIPNFIGQPLTRFISWTEEGHLKLTTDGHVTRDGEQSHDELIWRRVAP